MKILASLSIICLAAMTTGCASQPGSFAYEVANGSERSKYTKDTVVTQEQMDALDSAGTEMKAVAENIQFNGGDFTYSVGEATDAATLGAVAGSAAGLLDAMSGLDMAMFGAMSLFDSSYVDKRKIRTPDAILVRKQTSENDNTGRKGFVTDLRSVAPDINNSITMLADKNGWKVHPDWAVNNKDFGFSTGYVETGICPEGRVLTFYSRSLYKGSLKNGHSMHHGEVSGDKIGKHENEKFNLSNIELAPWCGPSSKLTSWKEMERVSIKNTWAIAMQMSLLDSIPDNLFFYMPPSKFAFPVPALVNKGEIFWMAKVK